MRNESVAILDVRSYELTFYLGSKGVNDTFVFYGSHTEKYDGFSKDGFFSGEGFRRAVVAAITTVRQNYEGVIGEIFVGVPSAFISVMTKGHTLSFPSKRKISAQDVDALFESGRNGLLCEKNCIRHSEMYLSLGDNRKYFHPQDVYGVPTPMLQGGLCYYFIDDTFYELATAVLNDLGFEQVRFLPTTLAQAQYLLPEKRREGYAFLLDIGFLTSSLSVVYGNGIVHEETFDCGVGTILVLLMQTLDVDYETAEEILSATDISGIGDFAPVGNWVSEDGEREIPMQIIADTVKCGLDELCENVENFFEKYYPEKKSALIAVNPISVTGEGVNRVTGALGHIARRLNRLTESIAPDLPYYDKPKFSSRMALLAMALSDKEKRGFWKRIFNFGGKKK